MRHVPWKQRTITNACLFSPVTNWGVGVDFNINVTTAAPYTHIHTQLTNCQFKGKLAVLKAVFHSPPSLVYYAGTAALCDSSTTQAKINRKINY